MALKDALSSKPRSTNEARTSQFDGIKLSKDDVSELYKLLGLEPGTSGAEAFEGMIETVTGQTSPERQERSADGSKFIGKKLSLTNTDKDTVFTSHVKLTEALSLPATASGAQVFRALLEKFLTKK